MQGQSPRSISQTFLFNVDLKCSPLGGVPPTTSLCDITPVSIMFADPAVSQISRSRPECSLSARRLQHHWPQAAIYSGASYNAPPFCRAAYFPICFHCNILPIYREVYSIKYCCIFCSFSENLNRDAYIHTNSPKFWCHAT